MADEPLPGRLDVAAEPAAVGRLRTEARAFALDAGASGEVAADVALAVTEAATNAVLHAFVGRAPGQLALRCEARHDQLRVRVLDDGRGMQPRSDSPGLGLGLSTMGSLATSMDVREGAGGTGTEVVLTFTAPGVDGPAAGLRDPRAARLLTDAARLAQRAVWPQEGVERLAELLVGELGDAITVDVVGDGVLRRLSARVAGDETLSTWLATSLPPSRPGTATWAALHSGDAHLTVHDPTSERTPGGPGEVLGLNWWLAVPLGDADGRPLGLLGIGGRGDRPGPGPDEQALAVEVAARAAGGLAHASALEGLRATRERLERVLGALEEGVTLDDADGRVLYANTAAANAIGAPSPEMLVEAGPGALAGRLALTGEDGRPITPEDLPTRRVLAGEDAPPLVLRGVDRSTGTVRWLRLTAHRLDGDDGGPLAVGVAQDVTAERRAALRREALQRVGELLDVGDATDPQVLAAVCAALVPAKADGCVLDVADGPSAALGLDPSATDRRLAVPLRGAGVEVGTLTLAHGESGRAFDAEDRRFAEDLARRVGLAVAYARLARKRNLRAPS